MKVDGHDVLKWSVDEERNAQAAQKKAVEDAAAKHESKMEKKFKHQPFCILCHCADVSDLNTGDAVEHHLQRPELNCVRCPTSMHVDCTPGWSVVQIRNDGTRRQAVGGWVCPHHRCKVCWRTAHESGGLLFRCVACPTSLCEECLPEGFEPVASQQFFGKLNYAMPRSFETIRCDRCAVIEEQKASVRKDVNNFLKKFPRWKKSADPMGYSAMNVHFSERFPASMRLKLPGKGKSKGKNKTQVADTNSTEMEPKPVEVLADGEWWKALIVKKEGDKVMVKYDGGVDEEDEWIEEGSDRIREPQPEQVRLWSEVLHEWRHGQIVERVRGWARVTCPQDEEGEWVPMSSNRLRREGDGNQNPPAEGLRDLEAELITGQQQSKAEKKDRHEKKSKKGHDKKSDAKKEKKNKKVEQEDTQEVKTKKLSIKLPKSKKQHDKKQAESRDEVTGADGEPVGKAAEQESKRDKSEEAEMETKTSGAPSAKKEKKRKLSSEDAEPSPPSKKANKEIDPAPPNEVTSNLPRVPCSHSTSFTGRTKGTRRSQEDCF